MSTPEPIAVRAAAPAVLDLPPAHLELTWRPLHVGDAAALHVLVEAAEAADHAPQRTSAPEVEEMFEGSWKDLQQDTLGGFDAGGTLRAYAMVEVRPGDSSSVRAFLTGGVHPDWRGRGLGRAVLTWAEGRGRQKLAESGKDLPARLATYVDEQSRDHRRLYAAAGFSPIRWYTDMRRDLSVEVPRLSPPRGVRVVRWTAELDEDTRAAHNAAFADHWGSEPQTAESWRHDVHFAPAWSFLALDRSAAEPVVVGYLLSGRYEQDWAAQGYTCGYTNLLGVRPQWRGQGIAGALLTRAMGAYRRSRMQYACLGVDTANPTGAQGLYARLGYEATHGSVLYSVEI
ncbi:MAG TPA: GNAT family N-acetyltransferase [Actinotalea sp.]|nr:GNAT family N-acetyltransferase [Actinotalea sp.]